MEKLGATDLAGTVSVCPQLKRLRLANFERASDLIVATLKECLALRQSNRAIRLEKLVVEGPDAEGRLEWLLEFDTKLLEA